MYKSINLWAFDDKRPLPEVFKMAKQNGFDAVELIVSEDGQLNLQSTEDDCKRLIDEAGKAGVRFSSVASGLGWAYPITATNPDTARKGIDSTAKSLRLAKWLGVDAILLVPGGVGAEFIPNFQGAPYDVAYENARKGLHELKAVAEETGVTIGVENVWNKFLLSPLELRDFVDEIGSKNVGVYFDAGNVVLTGYPEQWIDILGKRITRVHLKDFKRSIGNIDGFCDLLDGDVDYPAVMKSLRAAGYDNALTAEFFNAEDQLGKISKAIDKILSM